MFADRRHEIIASRNVPVALAPRWRLDKPAKMPYLRKTTGAMTITKRSDAVDDTDHQQCGRSQGAYDGNNARSVGASLPGGGTQGSRVSAAHRHQHSDVRSGQDLSMG